MKKHLPIILLAAAMLAASCDRNAVRTVNLENIPATEPYTAGLESIMQKVETVELKCDSLYDIRIFADYDGRLFGRTADNKLVITYSLTEGGETSSMSATYDGTALNVYVDLIQTNVTLTRTQSPTEPAGD